MKPGDLIADRFRIEKVASSGGMGVVYRAHDARTNQPVAVKVLHHPGFSDRSRKRGGGAPPALDPSTRQVISPPSLDAATEVVHRFAREAEVLAQLNHPGIVRYVAHGVASAGQGYLAIEWLDGEDLSTRLARGPALTHVECLAIARATAVALGAAHDRGIVHRDVKPSNLFLVGSDVERIKVLDFGVARLESTRDSRRTRTGTALGTPAYMAPEQARGERELDARVDVFALGCVLFECLTGRAVFVAEHVMAILAKVLLEEAPRASELRRDVPRGLDDLIARMLSKTPAERPRTGAAVAAELDSQRVSRKSEAEDAAPASADEELTLVSPTSRPARAEKSAPEGLTAGERTLISVVLAQAGVRGERPSSRPPMPGSERVRAASLAAEDDDLRRSALAETLRPDDDAATLDKVRGELAPFSARVERLLDGSIVGTLTGGGNATDQAARAARFALAMRAILPDMPMALATGRGFVLTDRWPVGDVIDRAAKLVRGDAQPRSTEFDHDGAAKPRSDAPAKLGGGMGLGQRPIRLSWGSSAIAGEQAASLGAGMMLSSAGGPRGVRIDDVTAGLLDVRFDVRGDAAGLSLKAEREQMEATRTLLGRPTPCVGRERELLLIAGIYDECIAEPVSRAVLVTGAAGVGKSRLRHEFLRKIKDRGDRCEVWIARGDSMSAGTPFGIIAPAIRRTAGIYDGEPLVVRRQKLRARLGRSVASDDLTRVADFLGELIGAPFPDEESVKLRAARQDPVLMVDQMRGAWETFLTAETQAQPLIIVLEDLHWGDAPSLEFLDAALRSLESRPFMVFALGRPEVRDLFPKLWEERDVHELRLAELTKKASEKLVRAMLDDPSNDVTARLVSQAAGNAFYLEELIRAVAEGKDGHLPETVLAMVETRLSALDPDARRVLRAGSVFGQLFWRGGVATLLGGDETLPALAHLDALVDLEILARRSESRFPGQVEYYFRQSIVREAAYAMLTEADRKLGHKLAGEWLERAGEVESIVLAEHFERGDDRERAAERYLIAAADARDGNDLAATIARVERGVRCGATGECLGQLRLIEAEAHDWRSDSREAARAAEEALALLPENSPGWYLAIGELGVASGKLRKLDRLDETAALLRQVSLGEGEDEKAIAIARIAIHLVVSGRYAVAGELMSKLTREGVIKTSSPRVTTLVSQTHALHSLQKGDLSAFVRHTRATIETAERAGDLRHAHHQRANLGYGLTQLGALDEAIAELRRARDAGTTLRVPFVTQIASVNLGLALAYDGSIDEARELEEGVLRQATDSNDARVRVVAGVYLAIAECLAGNFPAAEVAARAAASEAEPLPPLRVFALALVARAELGQLRRAEALETANLSREMLTNLGGVDGGEALARLTYAEVHFATGGVARARSLIREARDRLLERADLITESASRQSFLTRVPENAATFARAREWLPEGD